MVRLFLSDIDDCLTEPFAPYDLVLLSEVQRRAQAARGVGETGHPAVSLLSGRAHGYVEAFAQLLGTHVPVFFEAGAGAFDRASGRTFWHPALTADIEASLTDVRAWLLRDLLPSEPALAFDYGKRAQVGVIGPDRAAIDRVAVRVKARVAEAHPGLVAFATPVSVDVMSAALTKREAIGWIAQMTGVAPSEMAYVGDSEGDVGALASVGFSFAPSNAAPAVRQNVRCVTQSARTRGVIEAYDWCVAGARNQAA